MSSRALLKVVVQFERIAKNRPEEDRAADVPHFLSFKSLKPFVDRHLGDLQSIIVKYRARNGNVVAVSVVPLSHRSPEQYESINLTYHRDTIAETGASNVSHRRW